MEPRSLKYKRRKWEQNKKILKVLTSSVAISSLLIGGAKITTPSTYGAFTSMENAEAEISACFIFPSEVLKKRDRTSELNVEASILITEVLKKVEQIEGEALTEKIDSILTSNEKEVEVVSASDSSMSKPVDTSTVVGLEAQKENLNSQIITIEKSIEANKNKVSQLGPPSNELEKLKPQLENILLNDLPRVQSELSSKFEEIEGIISNLIFEVKERAIEECDYDPEFFDIIIKEIVGYKHNINAITEDIKTHQVVTQEQILNLEKQILQIQETIKELEKQIVAYELSINAIKASISNIDQQIITMQEKEKLEKEKLEKEKLEKEKLEKEKLEKEKLEKEKQEKEKQEKEKQEPKENQKTPEEPEEGEEVPASPEEGEAGEEAPADLEEGEGEDEAPVELEDGEVEKEVPVTPEEGEAGEESPADLEEAEGEEEAPVDPEEGEAEEEAPADPDEEEAEEEEESAESEQENTGEEIPGEVDEEANREDDSDELEEEETEKDDEENPEETDNDETDKLDEANLTPYLDVLKNEGTETFQAVAKLYANKEEEFVDEEEQEEEQKKTTIVAASKFGIRPK